MLYFQSALGETRENRSGKEVIETVCVGCHESGKDGAPKIGDQAEWAKRASRGLGTVTEHAITGIRKMPAHGSHASLSDLEISRAVAYLVSGGKSVDPSKPYSSPSQITGEQLVKERCSQCHATGKEGAPRIGVMADWTPRLQLGVENLVTSAIRGHNAMPARAGMANLSDADLRAAVTFMLVQKQPPQ
jgi:cytochrome c5